MINPTVAAVVVAWSLGVLAVLGWGIVIEQSRRLRRARSRFAADDALILAQEQALMDAEEEARTWEQAAWSSCRDDLHPGGQP